MEEGIFGLVDGDRCDKFLLDLEVVVFRVWSVMDV